MIGTQSNIIHCQMNHLAFVQDSELGFEVSQDSGLNVNERTLLVLPRLQAW